MVAAVAVEAVVGVVAVFAVVAVCRIGQKKTVSTQKYFCWRKKSFYERGVKSEEYRSQHFSPFEIKLFQKTS